MGTTKSHLRGVRWGATGIGLKLTLVTWPEEALTGTGSDRVRMRNRYMLYYYSSSSTKCSTSTMATGSDQMSRDHEGEVCACATGSCTISPLVGLFTGSDVIKRHVTPKGVPFENVGARMRNWKLRNIRTNVTGRASPGRIECAHAWPDVPLGCDFICSQTYYKRGLICFIPPTNHITGNRSNRMTESSVHQPIRKQDTKRNNQLQSS